MTPDNNLSGGSTEMPYATRVMDELLVELGSGSGPCERVIDEYRGNIESGIIQSSTIYPALNTRIHERADAAIQELRKTWGPTADPHWVDGIVPGRGQLRVRRSSIASSLCFGEQACGVTCGCVRLRRTRRRMLTCALFLASFET